MLKTNINKTISKYMGIKNDYTKTLDELIPVWEKLDSVGGSGIMVSIFTHKVSIDDMENIDVTHETDIYCDVKRSLQIATVKAIKGVINKKNDKIPK